MGCSATRSPHEGAREWRAHCSLALAGLIVGAVPSQGAAQCFTMQLSSPSQSSGDHFGQVLAADGSWLVVGANYSATTFLRDDLGTHVDATDDLWLVNAHFLSEDPFKSDGFGWAVAVEGDHMLVGAPFWPSSVFGSGPGAVYFYRRVVGASHGPEDDAWVQQALIEGPLPGTHGGSFGIAVSIEEDRAAVGATNTKLDSQPFWYGLVHVFRVDDGGTPLDPADDTWVPEAALTPANPALSEDFGAAIAFDGPNLLIGSPPDLFSEVGSAYHFRLDDGGTPTDPSDDLWIEHAKLTQPLSSTVQKFGAAVDLDGSRALIGSDGEVFVFELDNAGTVTDPADDYWVDAGVLDSADAGEPEDFGMAVSLEGDRALVGARYKFSGLTEGIAYLFMKSPSVGSGLDNESTWTEVTKLAAPSPPALGVGWAVKLEGDQAIVGERGSFPFLTGDGSDIAFGAALIFAMATPPWEFIEAPQAGVLDPPCLLGGGTLLPDTETVLAIDHAESAATTAVVVGLAELQAPIKGGVLVPAPDFVLGLMTDEAGSVTVDARWPAGVPAGFEFFIQAWVLDPSAPGTYASTNALHVEVP